MSLKFELKFSSCAFIFFEILAIHSWFIPLQALKFTSNYLSLNYVFILGSLVFQAKNEYGINVRIRRWCSLISINLMFHVYCTSVQIQPFLDYGFVNLQIFANYVLDKNPLNHGLRKDGGVEITALMTQISGCSRFQSFTHSNARQGRNGNKQGNAVMKAAVSTGFSMLHLQDNPAFIAGFPCLLRFLPCSLLQFICVLLG